MGISIIARPAYNHIMTIADPAFTLLLRRAGLCAADETPTFTPLTGGVSSDIWLAETRAGRYCLKKALAKLKVAADWFAPIERNAYEVAWMQTAQEIAPETVPAIRAHDPESGMFVMDYLDPADHHIWKEALHQGNADTAFAAAVGTTLTAIHAGTANDAALAARFATDTIFHAIRLEPYLEATARAHPDVARQLLALSRTTASTKHCLVHGDVSPKNILVSPANQPVFLDAECAWYGDPAFDLAFCLNHLLLKCLWTPDGRAGFLSCFQALADGYLAGVTWEPAATIEARASALLAGLFLARVDGKSPAEYITDDTDKDKVRRTALALLRTPVPTLAAVSEAWNKELTT